MYGNIHQRPVGVKAEWRPSVYVFVLNEQKELLVIKTPRDENLLELPGGAMEMGESLHEAGRRECLEETGYNIQVSPQPFLVQQRDFCYREAGVARYFCTLLFFCKAKLLPRVEHEPLNNKSEVSAILWQGQSELARSLIAPMFREAMLHVYEPTSVPSRR